MANPSKKIANLKPTDLQKFDLDDDFSYYPNPVKEELFLKWNPTNEYQINNIKLFNINGILVNSFDNLKETDSQNISFSQYPTGLYILTLLYSNNEEKTIKIIKE